MTRANSVITTDAEQPSVDLSHTAAGGADHLTGREVIARDVAVGRHGPSGKIVQFTGVERVLLAPRPDADDDPDGVEAYQCITCGRAYDTVHSAAAHRVKHSDRSDAPDYPIDTLRMLLRLMKTYQRAGRHNSAALTATELNRIRVKTLNGKPWNATQVSQLYSRWHEKIRVHVPRTTSSPATELVEVAEVTTPSTAEAAERLVKSFRQAEVLLEKLHAELVELRPAIDGLVTALASSADVDEDTRDKAQRWDEMQKLLGR